MQHVALAFALTLVPAATTFAQTASVDNFGGGTPGSAGVPVLAYDGAPIVDHAFALRVSSARANSTAVIGIGLSHAPVFDAAFGATIHVGGPLYTLGILPTDAHGRTPSFLPLANVDASLAGVEFVVQALVADPFATGGLAFTAGLEVRLGTPAWPLEQMYPVRTISTTTKTDALASADVDGDGITDILTANSNPPSFGVLRGLGERRFAAEVTYPALAHVSDLAVGDVNSDGAPDVMLDSGQLYLNDGNGGFTLSPTTPPIGWSDVELADFNGDGHLDVLSSMGFDGFEIGCNLGFGDGTFAAPLITAAWNYWFEDFQVTDFNNDGALDFVCIGQPGGDINVFLGAGDGTFPTSREIQGDWYSGVAIGDFNGDGHVDLASAEQYGATIFSGGYVRFHPGDGAGNFYYADGQHLFAEQGRMRAGDFDEDGNLDLVVGATDYGDLRFLRGRGDGTFEPHKRFGWVGNYRDLLVADIDDDGDLDVASAIGLAGETLQFGGGDGTFGVNGSLLTSGTPWNAQSTHVADVDLDGVPDLVTRLFSAVDVRLGLSGGVFGPAMPVVPSVSYRELHVFDADLDGTPDIVGVDLNTGQLLVQLGIGDGSFGAPIVGASAPLHQVPAVGDVDGDGVVDLLYIDASTDVITIHSAQGDGTFVPVATNALGGATGTTSLVDLDTDGILDLVVLDFSTQPKVHTLQGLGGGTFGAPLTVALGARPRDFAFGDANGDGLIDLVFDDDHEYGVGRLHYGTPGPSFGAELAAQGAIDFVFADVDSDGFDDLVSTAGGTFRGCAVYFGRAASGFGPVQYFDAGAVPCDVTVADLDGDGMLDIVVTNRISNDLTVLLNQLVD